MLHHEFHSAGWAPTELQYPSAIAAPKNDGVEYGRFAGSGVGHCPEIPQSVVCASAPKRHTARQAKL
jgi:hypothetical protein